MTILYITFNAEQIKMTGQKTNEFGNKIHDKKWRKNNTNRRVGG